MAKMAFFEDEKIEGKEEAQEAPLMLPATREALWKSRQAEPAGYLFVRFGDFAAYYATNCSTANGAHCAASGDGMSDRTAQNRACSGTYLLPGRRCVTR